MAERIIQVWRIGALIAVAAVAAVNLADMALRVPPVAADSPAPPADPVLRQEARLAALRRGVATRGLRDAVGYLGSVPKGRLFDDPHGVEDYYLAQFVLVPLVLDPDISAHDWAVANVRDPAPATKVPPGWRVAEDFGGGVMLLKKERP